MLERHGEEAITRNAYGARCLNSPRALFADIDFARHFSFRLMLIVFAALEVIGLASVGFTSWGVALALTFVCFLLAYPVTHLAQRTVLDAQGGAEQLAYSRIARFAAQHPDWSLRLYRTPAGYRVLATHQTFDPASDAVAHFFAAVGADPVYVRMCRNQHCFRARLTAKPWRIGIADHLRPRPGVWPIKPERMAERAEWVATYEARAASYAACAYLETLGSGAIDPQLAPVVALHDSASGALVPGATLA